MSSTGRVDGSRQFIPDLHFVAIGITEEHIRLPGHELAVVANLAARAPNRGQRVADVGRAPQPEAEMRHPAGLAGLARLAFEDEHIPAARRLGLDEVVLTVDGDDPEDRLVKAQGPPRVADGKRHVRESLPFHRWTTSPLASHR